MNATTPPLDLYSLPPTDMLTTEQVGTLGIFGAKATLEQGRCLGKPGPKFVKITGRIFYRVSDLLAYLAVQEAETEREMSERRERFAARARKLHDSPLAKQAAALAASPAAEQARQLADHPTARAAARARRTA